MTTSFPPREDPPAPESRRPEAGPNSTRLRSLVLAPLRNTSALPARLRGDASRRLVLIAAAIGGAGLFVVAGMLLGGGEREAAGSQIRTSLAAVTRQTLSSQVTVDGVLGYGDAAPVGGSGLAGTVTWLPAVGSVVERNEPLYAIDERPVPLLYGSVPLYRTLRAGEEEGTELRDARAALQEAELNLKLQQERLNELLAGGSAAGAAARQASAQQAVTRAENQLAAAREQLHALLNPGDEALAAANTRLLQAQNALHRAEQQKAQLTAPPTASERAAAEAAVAGAEARLAAAVEKLGQARIEGTGAEIRAAEAEHRQAQAQLTQAREDRAALDSPPDPAAVATADNDLLIALEELRQAQAEVDRLMALRAGAGAAGHEIEAARRGVTEAEAALEAARLELQALLGGPSASEVDAARLAVLQAERQVITAREKVEDLEAATAALGRADVRQIQENLAELGYGGFEVSGLYDAATAEAVRAWQSDLGLPATGVIEPGQLVFAPGPLRITEHLSHVGASAGEPQGGGSVLRATATTPVVTVALDPALQARVKIGDAVTVTLPDRQRTEGTVSSIGSVASANSTIAVEVELADPAAVAMFDQAPVSVIITTAVVEDALVVPITALVALAGGGHGLEVAHPNGTREIVPVNTGLFDTTRGLVQVSGERLQEGQQVVVPGR